MFAISLKNRPSFSGKSFQIWLKRLFFEDLDTVGLIQENQFGV
jgi:hypothetical protein